MKKYIDDDYQYVQCMPNKMKPNQEGLKSIWHWSGSIYSVVGNTFTSNALVAFIFSVCLTLIISWADDWYGADSPFDIIREMGLGVLLGMTLWLSCAYLNSWLSARNDWINAPWKSFFTSLAANIIVVTINMNFIYLGYFLLFYDATFPDVLNWLNWPQTIFGVSVSLFITAIYQGAYFLRFYKATLIESEQLKSANLVAKYEALNAQINPHFLFNSLNVLSNLVRTNPDKAEDFIQGLSNVYRYVLDIRKEESVLLADEVEALSNYTDLVKTRFGERIQVDDQLSPKLHAGQWIDRRIIPLALQMLIENAVKHNGATQSNPLHIKIYEENDWIVVTNNRPPRFEESVGNGVGLTNIQERYQLLVDKEIVIEDTEASYTVKLPLI